MNKIVSFEKKNCFLFDGLTFDVDATSRCGQIVPDGSEKRINRAIDTIEF